MPKALEWLRVNDFSPGILRPERGRSFSGVQAPPGSAIDAHGCLASPSGALVPGWDVVEVDTRAAFNNNWGITYRPAGGKQYLMDTGIWSPSLFLDQISGIEQTIETPDHIFEVWSENYDATATTNYARVHHFKGYGLGGRDGSGDINTALNTSIQPDTTWADHTYSTTYSDNSMGGSIAMGRAKNYDRSAGTWGFTAAGNAERFPVVTASMRLSLENRTYPDLDTDLWLFGGSTPAFNTTIAWDTQAEFAYGGAATCYHQGRFVCSWYSRGRYAYNGPITGNHQGTLEWDSGLRYTPVEHGAVYDKDVSGLNTSYYLPFGESNDMILWLLSINANTLMVMTQHGAYLIRGDLDRPQITYLAGVPHAYFPFTKPVATPQGIFYATKEGVYVISESGQAKPASSQLPGSFWVMEDTTDVYAHRCATGRLVYRDPYVLAPNNFMMDTGDGSWWRLADSNDVDATTPRFNQYQVSSTGCVYGFPWYVDNETDIHYVRYDPSRQLTGSDTYDFTSNYLYELNVEGHGAVVREVEAVLQGYGTIVVQIFSEADDTATTATFTVDSASPQRQRANVVVHTNTVSAGTGGRISTGVYYRITATGDPDVPLPSVYELAFGYQPGVALAS